MCDRCEELEEEVAYLRSELGLNQDATDYQRLRVFMRGKSVNARQAARLILALYQAKGRAMSRLQLLDALPSPSDKEDRNPNLIGVMVCHARAGLGREAVENVWGHGYRLSDEGVAKVRSILSAPLDAAA